MSFDTNVLSSKPIIKAAANMQNDGGGGNLGYMSQGRKQKENKKEEINIFSKKPELDSFSLSSKITLPEEESFDITKWMSDVSAKIKKTFNK